MSALNEEFKKMKVTQSSQKPKQLTPYFFTGEEAPFDLHNYDVLGFNAACLVKWNEAAMSELVISSTLADLVELFPEDYPEQIKDIACNYNKSPGLNHVVWDI